MQKKLPNTTVYVVGDSTLSAFSDDYYMPRYGYGTQLFRYLSPEAEVVNLALSGRSSKSFLTEENYKILLSSLSAGDYLVIGFGHNDEKGEDERYTNPNLGYLDEDCARGVSFRNNLYKNYIVPARERGAIPILCTPIVRLSEDDDYSGSCGHITLSSGKYEGGDYPAAIRSLGESAGVTVIDLTRSSMQRYKEVGHEKAALFHAWAATSGGRKTGLDFTHLNKYGAAWTAFEWAKLLAATDNPLKNHLVPRICPPAEELLAQAVNAAYIEPSYKPFSPEDAKKAHFGAQPPWYVAVMGDFGGSEHVKEFIAEREGDGWKLGNGSTVARGKISGSSDGFAAVFAQLGADKNFEFSARATLLSLAPCADGQTAFGIMVRDDIYVDEYVPSLSSNYVAAGVLGGGKGVFSREGGKLSTYLKEGSAQDNCGKSFTLRIKKVNQQTVVCCDGDERAFFDFDFVSVDNNFCYVCLFANRGAVVKFDEVAFAVTGDAVRA